VNYEHISDLGSVKK